MMKQLSVFGAAVGKGASALLAVVAFCIFWGFIAFGIYSVVQWLGFSDKAAYWSAIISVGTMVLPFCLRRSGTISEGTLTKWGLRLIAWVLIAAVVLVIGFAVVAIIITPPSLYSLAVVGLVLLAGILWQLTKLANKR